MRQKLVEMDSRGRVSLGKYGWHKKYLAHFHSDGMILLLPVEGSEDPDRKKAHDKAIQNDE